MPKTTTTYWNVLAANSDRWKPVEGVSPSRTNYSSDRSCDRTLNIEH